MPDHETFMRRCIELAQQAVQSNDTLVGSLVVRDGKIIGEGVEAVKSKSDITAHAEIEAIKAACTTLKITALSGCTLYSTAEPCFMCSYAIRQTRISLVVFGRAASGVGGITSSHPILTDVSIENWNPPPDVVSGVLEKECGELLGRRAGKIQRV
jgi:tRNA(adenine34) deaminase